MKHTIRLIDRGDAYARIQTNDGHIISYNDIKDATTMLKLFFNLNQQQIEQYEEDELNLNDIIEQRVY